MQRTEQQHHVSGNPCPTDFPNLVYIKIKEGLDPAPFLVFAKFLLERNVVWRPPAACTSCGRKAELSEKGHSTVLSTRKRRVSEQQLCGSDSLDSSPSPTKKASPVVVLKDVIQEELMRQSSNYKRAPGTQMAPKEGSSASALVSTFAGQEAENGRRNNWPPQGLDPEPFEVIAKFLQERNMYLRFPN